MTFLLLVSDALVRADGLYLSSASTARVEFVSQPLLCQLPCQLQADDTLTHAENLGVVAQNGPLDRVGVVGGDGTHAVDLVGGNGDTETGTTDEECSVNLAASDLASGGDSNVRIGGLVSVGGDSNVDDGFDSGIGFEVLDEGVLVIYTGFITAEGDLPLLLRHVEKEMMVCMG